MAGGRDDANLGLLWSDLLGGIRPVALRVLPVVVIVVLVVV